jgi:hypothetical protein
MSHDNPEPQVYCGFCNAATKHPRKHLRKCHEDAYAYLMYKVLPWDKYFTYSPLPNSAIALNKERLYKMAREVAIQRKQNVPTWIPNTYTAPPAQVPEIFSFIWDDIQFKNKEVQIYIKRLDKRFLPIEAPKSTELLNKIKEEFFTRHHGNKLYKLSALNSKVILNASPDVNEILHLIDDAIELYNFRHERKSKSRFLPEKMLSSLSNDQILNIFKKNADKGPYIKFLYNLHHQGYKLIPILESIGSSLEESFLFRIKGRSQTFIVWENINPARATYIFRTKDNDGLLQNILTYISEHEKAKRLYLKDRTNFHWAFNNLGYVGCVEHEGIESYKVNLHNYIR